MWVPKFKLLDTSLDEVLTFPVVQFTNAPQSVKDMIEHTNPRGKGSIIIEGGEAPWTLEIRGIIFTEKSGSQESYEELMSKVDELESIEIGVPYYLNIDKTPSSVYQYHVKRIEPIRYQESLRTSIINYACFFRVNSW